MVKTSDSVDFLQSLHQKWFYALTFSSSLLLFGLAAVFWWQHIYTDPQRVFWAMLDTSLSTPGVTKRIKQNSQEGSLDQTVQLSLGSRNLSHAQVYLSKQDPSGQGSVTSQTETIGTLTADYVRYTGIKDTTKHDKPQPNINSLINVWGKNDVQTKGGQLLRESVLNIVPFANLTRSQRQELIQTIQRDKVYSFNKATVERSYHNGRPIFTYQVSVDPQAYIRTLQIYAQKLGLGEMSELNPETYADAPATKVTFRVDGLSRQLLSVSYGDDPSRSETYSGYGVVSAVDVPKQTITLNELRQRLQNL